MKLPVSLHTHTFRCKHASGTEREYIENAISNGLEVLGFSDHAPMPFSDGYRSNFRMDMSETEDYFNTLTALRDEYKNKIDIKIGFEVEYYPLFFKSFLQHVTKFPIDYLILGQHFIENEITRKYAGISTSDESFLEAYTKQAAEGIDTGVITYVAHPDLVKFTGSLDTFKKHYSLLIEHAILHDIPLEINCLGIRDHRHYPDERFIALCGEMGAKMCVGCDAHTVDSAADNQSFKTALELMQKYNVKFEKYPSLRPVHVL